MSVDYHSPHALLCSGATVRLVTERRYGGGAIRLVNQDADIAVQCAFRYGEAILSAGDYDRAWTTWGGVDRAFAMSGHLETCLVRPAYPIDRWWRPDVVRGSVEAAH